MASDFLPTAPIENLRMRGELLERVRSFFTQRGFIEVETPLLSHDVIIDRHLDPLSLILPDDARRPDLGERLWMQTSPEFGMKRLLAAGMEAIFQVAKAFRGGEVGPRHNPEFTMVEWYRVGDDMHRGISLLSDFCLSLLGTPAERLSYADAFERHVGLNPHLAEVNELKAAAVQHAVDAPDGLDDRDAWLNLLLACLVEPMLGRQRPTILHDYPQSQAALATVREGVQPVAERFELYVEGIELANGYHELLDPTTLRERNARANAARRLDGKPTLPEESRLLDAMEAGLPPCTGVALGFDRLAMICANAKSLREVMAFPIDRA